MKRFGNISFACYVFGLYLFLFGSYHVLLEWKTYGWERVEGAILTSELGRTRLPSQPGWSQKAIIKYQYAVDGKSYVSGQIKFGFKTLGLKFLERRISEKYPAGSTVFVYYSSTHPQKSVLEPGISFGSLLEFMIGLFLLYLGFVIGNRHNPSSNSDAHKGTG